MKGLRPLKSFRFTGVIVVASGYWQINPPVACRWEPFLPLNGKNTQHSTFNAQHRRVPFLECSTLNVEH
jgi:hypothetical protein